MVLMLGAAGILGDGESTHLVRDRTAETETAARLAATASPTVGGVVAATAMGPRRSSGVGLRDGLVLTTTAAVDGSSTISVSGDDGASHAATVVGRDELAGLALLQVEGSPLEPARLASGNPVDVGAWVLALGASEGTPWVSTGVVSSLGGWVEDGTGTKRAGMIVTNASAAGGAHGGALVDRSGHVVGILAGRAGGDGALVAIPVSVARGVSTQLAQQGWAVHGALGAHVQDEDAPRGARVTAVESDSGAAAAGIEPGDVVVAVAGSPVRDTADLIVVIRRRLPGETVEVRVRRGGTARRIAVVLGTATSTGADEPAQVAGAVPLDAAG